ncbi:DEAD/DEAH box helicase [Polaromonas sp.]|uniref:DEAD/DEAH box helicase n=1 Tax=Polaromonas sp. TaxID=1869339 RepID=UPI00352A2004
MKQVFKEVPAHLSLWQHQRDAIDFAIEHLNHTTSPSLIRMPTGTGKTGVIAALAMCSCPGRTLILTPWVNLRAQIASALTGTFWRRIGQVVPRGRVEVVLPSNLANLLKQSDVTVMVASFAALNDIRINDDAAYRQLASEIELVLVDEGHYEPAVEWGQSVKGLNTRTVLLTATPYRNDLKLFRISDPDSSVFQFTHKEAEEKGILRKVDFSSLGSSADISEMSKAFIGLWKSHKSSKNLPAPAARAIICCDDAEDIQVAVEILNANGVKSIGIHDTFKLGGNFRKDVPLEELSAEVWVHQRKLAEGLDDSRFCCVAFFGRINNDRRLIQQIGRIVRTSTDDRPGKNAMVMVLKDSDVESRWLAYREFEIDTQIYRADHFRKVVDGLLRSQPPVEYFDGRFRRRFDPSVLSTNPQVGIAPSVLVRVVSPGFRFTDYIDQCTDTLNLKDAIILGPDPNKPCQSSAGHAVWVYASVGNSRLLDSSSLYEVTLEAHCAAVIGDYLLISDTAGAYPEDLLETSTSAVEPYRLSSLFDGSFRMTNVAVQSSVPFDSVIRGAELRGSDLGKIAASLTDRIQICRAARGAAKSGWRYVGFQRGRIRQDLPDALRRTHSVADFLNWAQTVEASLRTATPSAINPVLTRFLQPSSAPSFVEPRVLSLDLQQSQIKLLTNAGESILAKALSSEISPRGGEKASNSFGCTLEFESISSKGKSRALKVELELDYQPSKGRFWFRSVQSNSLQVEEQNGTGVVRRSLAEYLNRNQEYVLIGLSNGEMVYQGRKFYAIDYSRAETSLIEKIKTFAVPAVYSEKGDAAALKIAKTAKVKEFLPNTLFRAIVNTKDLLPFEIETLVCDDLGTECADFVAVNFTTRQLAFIHAKVGSSSGISASAFHDVVSQALKNLVYLSPGRAMPEGVSSWTSVKKWNGTAVPRLVKKPPGGLEGKKLWESIRKNIIGTANAQLYVVLATSGCCNQKILRKAIENPVRRTAETGQLMHLLDALNGTAGTLGAQLEILDFPRMT